MIALLLASCTFFEPELAPITDAPLLVEVEQPWTLRVDAFLPTDLSAHGDGLAVLDGYGGRLLLFDAGRHPTGVVGSRREWGQPVHVSPASAGGWWLAAPDRGAVLRVAEDGAVRGALAIPGARPDEVPVAALELAGRLVVGLRSGGIVWLNATTGERVHELGADVDGVPLGAVADVAPGPRGGLLAVDALGPKVHRIEEGRAVSWFGHTGSWIGYLSKPKGAAAGPDGTVLVADSALGAVQLFEADGGALGALAVDGEVLRLAHPVAISALADGAFAVLDAGTATVHALTLSPGALADARESAELRHLRTPLATPETADAAAGGVLCLQCHDGAVNDDRYVWDPGLRDHPVDVEAEQEIPAFFPLKEGRLVCATCHSPHGVTTLEEAAGVREEGGAAVLVRHAAQGDVFTRLSRSSSELCVGCHGDTAHEGLFEGLDLPGGSGHPVGAALQAALARRGGGAGSGGLPSGVQAGCLACHAVHGAASEPLLRADFCLACHPGQAEPASNHPLADAVPPDRPGSARTTLPIGVGGETCAICHDALGGRGKALLRPAERGASLCTTCHDPARLRGPHGEVRGAHGLSCLGCHDVHGGERELHLLSTVGATRPGDPDGCNTCHGPGGAAARSGVQPGAIGHPVGDDTSCAACHPSAHHPTENLTPCGECHDDQRIASARGEGHGGVACARCHPPHARDATYTGEGALNPVSRRCLGCHAPGTSGAAAKVAVYDHPAPVFTPDGARWQPIGGLRLFSPGGELLPPGQNGELTCSTCHHTHGPDAADPQDNLRIPGWQEACSSCHGEEALILYRWFHRPERREAP